MAIIAECKKNLVIFLLIMAAPLLAISSVWAGTVYEPQLAPFTVKVNGQLVPHSIGFQTVLPGEDVTVMLGNRSEVVSLVSHDKILAKGKGALHWQAPKTPGHVPITIVRERDKKTVLVQLFIMRPATSVVNGSLNGYKIGSYPPPLNNLEAYHAPRGFIEVNKTLEGLKVSPHFTLGQFLSKQEGGYPKYLVLRQKLVNKLEYVLEEVNSSGIRTDSFVIMSGYRTPFYNKAIGNVPNSRHVYGGAADFYVDVDPKDGMMDDLNKDGKIDIKDAALIYMIADEHVERTGRTDLLGGVGLYRTTTAHGPFVHVDVRGSRARW